MGEPEETLDIARLRADTPGCAHRIHLNNAGAGLMPEPVHDAIQQHLVLESEIGGYEAAAAVQAEVKEAYTHVANLLHTRAHNVAFVENATVAYAQALSSIPFERGDVILTTQADYISNQIMFLSLQRRMGVELVRAPDAPEGGVDVEALVQLMKERRPRLVAVTQVPSSSGLIQPVAAIGRACRELDLLYLVDGCQAIGQLPVDIEEIGCDFFSATSRKFLRGPRGAGFLYVSDRALQAGYEPLFVDMRGAEWTDTDTYVQRRSAKRFENWEFSYALVLGTGAAARYALKVGVKALSERACQLAQFVRDQFQAVDGVRVLDRGQALGAIVTVAIPGWESGAFKAALDRYNINTSISYRQYARLDLTEKGVMWALRVSPHYYNTEEEVLEAVEAVSALVARA